MLYDASGNREDIRNDSEIYGSVPSSGAPRTLRAAGESGLSGGRAADADASVMAVE